MAADAAEERLRAQLYGAFKHRALLYYRIFDEMRRALGEAQASEILSRAIYARGTEIGAAFVRHGPADLAGLREAFVAMIPDEGRMFSADVERCDAGALDITLRRCPLKDAWLEAGVPEAEVATLCRIAGRVDNGTFEAAGFEFWADTWQPGRDGCCHLHIRPGKGG
ncbi:MAG TPA: L-2-amino-thiazoline-4-carboxylic acid hydrolase [Candidatus Limnocylindria bacterium]|nr:L-2-amino-thiazoline-4-carboxylic acid hydrolase [Candidatus Limnocylindria bacterium]